MPLLSIIQVNRSDQINLMRRNFMVREHSLPSLASSKLSVHNLMHEKSLMLGSRESQSKVMSAKDKDISKLKINLDQALQMVVKEAIVGSRAQGQTSRMAHTKSLFENKYKATEEQLRSQRERNMQGESRILQLSYQLDKQKQQMQRLQEKSKQKSEQVKALTKKVEELESLGDRASQIEPLTLRIKTLELNIREQKLACAKVQQQKQQLQKHTDELSEKLNKAKPCEQELRQRIKYLERLNLESQRKMEDYYRKEHQFKKQIQHFRNLLNKMTVQKNQYRKLYEETQENLKCRLANIRDLQQQLAAREQTITTLTRDLKGETQRRVSLEQTLQETKLYYQSIVQENKLLKTNNHALVEFEAEVRKTIASHLKIAEEMNLYIVSRNNFISSLEQQNQTLLRTVEELEKKFQRLDKCYQQGSARGETEIKESYYALIRENDKLRLQNKEMIAENSERVLKHGEERDNLIRKVASYVPAIPNQDSPYPAIIADKTEEILMLQTSNDQLLNAKKQQEENIKQLEKLKEENKKQIYTLRLKAADLFRAKKEVEDANKKIERYQLMIEQKTRMITDLNEQIDILRAKSKQVEEKNFALNIENKNYASKVQELDEVMKQLNVEHLKAKKTQNEKNTHLLSDSIQKMQSGIASLAYYFSCCFCGQLLSHPMTLAPCGHNYCAKCKDAYAEYCYACDTGEMIQKVYTSKFLKEATAKYKFLTMVVEEVKSNIIEIDIIP